MKKAFFFSALLFNCGIAFCQNVGVGTTTPATLLQVGNFSGIKNTALTISTEGAFSTTPAGDRVAQLKLSHLSNLWGFSFEANDGPGHVGLSIKTHNNDSAGITRMYVDRNTGNIGIGTTSPASILDIRSAATDESVTLNIGNSDQSHQLLLFGGRQNDPNPFIAAKEGDPIRFANIGAGFSEWMRITPTGDVGIGYSNPTYKLAVNGAGYFYNGYINDVAAVKGYSTVNSRFAPGVIGTGASIGVLGNANTVDGVGLMGYNNVGNAALQYMPGAGVHGFSSGGHGVAGVTTKTGYAGVFGSTTVAGAYAGQFFSSDVAWALNTVGRVKLNGIGEGAGKVLTSDASGNATWQTPVTGGGGGTTNISFSGHLSTSVPVLSGTTYSLSGLTTEYQFGSGFNEAEGLFIAPSDGVYQLTTRIGFWVVGSNPVYSVVSIKRNSVTGVGCEFDHTTPGSNNDWYESLNYTKTMNLSQGENVYVTYKLTQVGANSITVSGDGTPNTSFLSIVKLY